MSYLIISCIFGPHFKYVYPAPVPGSSYFFTNNKTLQIEITQKGWKYVYVNFDLTNDVLTSSLQSKYIKFLRFLTDFPQFQKYEKIIYFDHKFYITKTHIDKLLSSDFNDYSVIIRSTPSFKGSIFTEVACAKPQARYAKNINTTINFINKLIEDKKIIPNVRICNTGLIVYNQRQKVSEMLDNIYNKCIEHQQPECQIYWSIFSQKYSHMIKIIPWKCIDVLWRAPLK